MTSFNAPRKRFGQNFLDDPAVIQRILGQLQGLATIPLVEIGPGRGALTVPLLESRGTLDVIEIDRDLVDYLEQRCHELGHLKIHSGNVLEFDFRKLGYEKMDIIGNLPYNISTPVLFHLLKFSDLIHSMTFMLQKEVVDRITAAPGSGDYGRLTVMVQSGCTAERLFNIDPSAFTPAPAVVSSLLVLTPLPTGSQLPAIRDRGRFAEIVRQAFNQRRKTIRNSLADSFKTADLEALRLDPGTRAENLSVEDYIRLANYQHDINGNPQNGNYILDKPK